MSVDQEDSSMWEFMLEVVSKGADNVVRWVPGIEVVDIDGQPLEPREYQPTLWNFLYSNHLYLAIFVVTIDPLLCVFRAMCLQPYFSQWLLDYGAGYTDHQALWLCLKAFLPGREQSATLYEYALLFHYFCNVSPGQSNTDLLLIAILEILDIFLLEVLYLHPRGIQYRLIPTTIIGVAGIIHYAYALLAKSDTYPMLQSFARFPELALIAIIIICVTLHVIAYIVTGGNVRRTFFLDARSMPSLHEDYTMALYRIGTIVIETSRVDGFRNELSPIAVPLGTIFERSKKKKPRLSVDSSSKRKPTCGYDNEQQDTNDLISTESNGGPRRVIVWTNFVFQIIQVFVEAIIRIINWFKSFCNGRQPTSNNTPQYNNNMDGADDIDWDEEIYQRFLFEELDERDDEDDDFTNIKDEGSIDEDSDQDETTIPSDELLLLGNDLREHEEQQPSTSFASTSSVISASSSASTSNILSTMQSILTHLMYSTPLTRLQYRRLTQNSMSSTPDESAALLALIHERRISYESTSQPITDRVCVVCHGEARQCLLKPCGCFALCNECRETMAQRKYKTCPCCRRTVEGYSRVYIP
ncbi:21830_t:CDS:2 [Gigaspora margarita]|uniref:21830_t:CDS:1 n=1 Tax=Gigaspora margarita TaxID=4874 RepID=A0ABN7UXY2_GIGMA|nr:21830_t:CDS:2 [Gigaspora margarita]